jgi:hypothetical protein
MAAMNACAECERLESKLQYAELLVSQSASLSPEDFEAAKQTADSTVQELGKHRLGHRAAESK